MSDATWEAVTPENCRQVRGPFYHGTKAQLSIGDLLSPGFASNYDAGRVLHHIYFSGLLEPAVWGAELAVAFAGLEERGSIYIVEPTGAFEDDPNLTNKRFPGNPTKSYRTREPLRVVGFVAEWRGHAKDDIRKMVESLQELKRRGLAIIED
ncbi:rifampin ADP-ribosyl transferase [Alicycliphilus denitrificans]|uniref:NAD(+)--rifampin ADP-ribosyltransferase n=1 Tax=Alicycliphilus denitrificans TaxID=179636 RepID=UPI0009658683|nr:NAD(+)--rifampin ADP-ribosyltransferase [Alicycliphilus denitrificans]MBN9575652.1 NAD(+)--rifampin ADP-ribosyltransferase [Alicycliphilus denitrificans]OJW87236.1 MAG: rifampin ADP-ribosylating transferase ARR-2 [Alicycliphilus sp. 69-12]BCN38020.1 rifampin ADP-ribosyl transferase [Alicycliphilus denitrificans]